jgi:membrane protein DedA with SNARE-associated domain
MESPTDKPVRRDSERVMTYTDKFFEYLQSLPGILVYLILGLSAFVENIFPPIPGDTITAFGALLVGIGGLSFFGVYFSTTLGSLLGFLFLFQIGAFLGRRFFIKKNIRFFKQKDILKAEEWFGKYGYYIIALNRFFPGIRSVIALVAGILHLKRIRVCLLALLSCSVWNLIWISLGYGLGSNWDVIEVRLKALRTKYYVSLLIFFGLFILAVIVWKWNRKRKNEMTP